MYNTLSPVAVRSTLKSTVEVQLYKNIQTFSVGKAFDITFPNYYPCHFLEKNETKIRTRTACTFNSTFNAYYKGNKTGPLFISVYNNIFC